MGLLTNPCPNCGSRVKKLANFCSRCGFEGEGTLTECPSCHQKVGRTSLFCWHCGEDLRAQKPPRVVGHRWVRDEEELAVRIWASDLKGVLERTVTVEAGTVGLVEKNGRFVRETEWGTQTLQHWLGAQQASIILMSATDVVLRPTFEGLRDVNAQELALTVQVVLRLADYDAFVRQYLAGGKRRVTYDTFEAALVHEMKHVTTAAAASATVDQMHADLDWRARLEEQLRAAMAQTMGRHGIELVQLSFVEVFSEARDANERQRAEVYEGNRDADFLAEKVAIRRRMAELEAQGKLADYEFEAKKKLAAYQADSEAKLGAAQIQAEHKKQVGELETQVREMNEKHRVRTVMAEHERIETIEQAGHELELKRLLRQFELADLEDEHERQRDVIAQELQREQERLDMRQRLELARTAYEAELGEDAARAQFRYDDALKEAESALKVAQTLDTKERIEFARTIEKDERRLELRMKEAQATLELKEAASDADVDRKIKYEKHLADIEIRKGQMHMEMTRLNQEYELEQLKVIKNAEVAVATSDDRMKAAVAETKTQQMEKRLDEQKGVTDMARDISREHMQHMKDMMAQMGQMGTGMAQAMGPAAAAQPGAAPAGAAPPASDESPCPDCNRPVKHTLNVCPYCAHRFGPK